MTSKELALADFEVDRILSLTDAEVEAECRARGEDPKAIAGRMRDLVEAAYLRSKRQLQ